MRVTITVILLFMALVVSSLVPASVASSSEAEDVETRSDVVLPVDNRAFKMGVGPHPRNFPTPTWDEIVEGYQMAGEWGEVTNYWDAVPWYEEEDMLVANATTRATIQALYTDNGMVPVFQTNVWDILTRPGYGFGAWLDVPPDLDPNATMADPVFRARWVDHVANISAEWQMEYYCLGNEVNSYHSWHAENAADFEANFPSLMAASYAAIKEVSPDTKVVLTFRLLELYHYDNLELLELFDGTMCDIMAFTSYPSRTGDYDTPADLPDDYYYRIADHTGTMSLAIAELGWTTHADFGGDEDEQAQFLTWFLEHTKDIPWEYVQWLELHDLRPEGSSTSHAQTVGLRQNDGTPKPVWDIWKDTFNLTYTGDWDRVPRGPILIEGDENFTLDNGVSSGNGSAEDPYIIEGWDIDGTDEGFCLEIRNATSVAFEVRNCMLHGQYGAEGTNGIILVDSSLAEFHDITVKDCGLALSIDIDSSGNLFYRNNFVHCHRYLANEAGTAFFTNGSVGNHWGDYLPTLFGSAEHDGVVWNEPYSTGSNTFDYDTRPSVNMFDHQLVPLEDQSRTLATTGDPMTFTLFSPVTDEMRSVEVLYTLDGGVQTLTLDALDASWGSLWGGSIDIPSNAMGPLRYIFVVTEMDWNTTISNITHIDVVDDDLPWVIDDVTPTDAVSGQELTFEVDVGDNIGVIGVWVEHWYGDGEPVNATMVETVTDRWNHTIVVQAGQGDLQYTFHLVDARGNWNLTEMVSLSLDDVTPPTFGEDTTSPEGNSGGTVWFRVNVTDDTAVDRVMVEYWVYTPFYYDNVSMEADGDVYSLELAVPEDVVGGLYYRFHAFDAFDNNVTSEENGISIVDDIPPTGTIVTTLPPTVGTGESYQVIVNVNDNIGVWTVVLYMYTDIGRDEPLFRSQNLLGSSLSFSGTVIMSWNLVGIITHQIVIEDLYGNTYTLPEGASTLVDTIAPKIENLLPLTTEVDQMLLIEVEASDNIGLTEVRWEGLPFEADGLFANGSFDEPGEYKVTVTVVDAAGNEASEDFLVFIEDDSSIAAVMAQIALVLVLAVVALVVGLWLLRKRSRESGGPDPELEDLPRDEIPGDPQG